MTIKKLSVTFDLPIQLFVSMLASANSGMKIDVYGDDTPVRKVKLLNGQMPHLLEGPKSARGTTNRGKDSNGNPVKAFRLILDHFVAHKDRDVPAKELKPLLVAVGLAANSVSPQLTVLKKKGLIRNPAKGIYKVTPRGLAEHAKAIKADAEASHG